MRYHGNWMSDFPKHSLSLNQSSICLNLTCSTIFLVNNDHRAIKIIMLIMSNIAELVTQFNGKF